ncbi:MAG TPA: response regulator [Gemmatimonadaceae bacterium]|jgi:CheY-like chemotaxis protein|nr:response regulator [Gemmatimonadaceae bacterium]
MLPLVCVVEDNPDNQLLVQAILEDRYAVRAYSDGPSALAAMRESPPDVVLLDISLPGMDGPDVLDAIRNDEMLRSLPVVAFTAHAMRGDAEHFLSLGFDGYVTKPIVDEMLLFDTLDRCLTRARRSAIASQGAA